MVRHYYTAILLVLFGISIAFATPQKFDSLVAVLLKAKEDSGKVKLIIELSGLYNASDTDTAYKYAKDALVLSEKINYPKGIAMAQNSIGSTFFFRSSFDSALFYYQKALLLSEKLGSKQLIAKNIDNIGLVYMNKGDYPTALNQFLKALRINEEIENKRGVAYQLNNISSAYAYQENHTKALEYLFSSLKISEKLGDDDLLSAVLSNIGGEYFELNDIDKALTYFLFALNIAKKTGNKYTIIGLLNNISSCYLNKKEYKKAMEYLQQCEQIGLEIGANNVTAHINFNIGNLYSEMGNFSGAIEYFDKALKLALESGSKEDVKSCYFHFADTYNKMGDYKNAYKYHQLYAQMKDTLLNEESTHSVAEMQTKYETEKKEKQIEIQNLSLVQQESEINRKQITIYAATGGIALLILLAFFIFRSYRLKQKANALLVEKNAIIEAQKKIVEEKNRDITSSIEYAKRIQEAMLPLKEKILEALPESFILYLPKDIVSGDFYWMEAVKEKVISNQYSVIGKNEASDKPVTVHSEESGVADRPPITIFIAAADCTGHGVPGALMSMIGSNSLNKILMEKKITIPAEILNHLNSEIKVTLKQKNDFESTKDGMDIALCKLSLVPINRNATAINSHCSLEYAGANRELVYFENGEMIEISPDKKSIGGYTDNNFLFTNHRIELKKDTMVYFFSDGYADQFGGPKGKRFMLKKLKELFKIIRTLPVNEQEKTLRNAFENWKGAAEQVDDVLIIGFRV